MKCPKCGSDKYYLFVHQIEGTYWYCPNCNYRESKEGRLNRLNGELQAEIAALREELANEQVNNEKCADAMSTAEMVVDKLREENAKLRVEIGETRLVLEQQDRDMEKLKARIEKLDGALNGITLELEGMLSAFPEVADVISNTNVAVLRFRIDEARAARSEK